MLSTEKGRRGKAVSGDSDRSPDFMHTWSAGALDAILRVWISHRGSLCVSRGPKRNSRARLALVWLNILGPVHTPLAHVEVPWEPRRGLDGRVPPLMAHAPRGCRGLRNGLSDRFPKAQSASASVSIAEQRSR
eukprot:3703216-Pyramimonas_sp.AAC.1